MISPPTPYFFFLSFFYSLTQVLSDEKKRKVYDEYGEEGLKGGIPAGGGGMGGEGGQGFQFNASRAEDIFAQFFVSCGVVAGYSRNGSGCGILKITLASLASLLRRKGVTQFLPVHVLTSSQ